MSTIQEIESAVTQLSAEQLADFRAWFAEFEAQSAAKQANSATLPEQEAWHQLAAHNLASAYGEDEPEYTVADLQKTNSFYCAS